jgi:hypothetical protein
MGWFFMRIVAADFCFYVAHRIFNTLNPLNKKQGIMFPVSFIEYKTMKLFSSVEKDKM